MVENRDFFIPLAFDAPVRRSASEYCHPVRCQTTKMVGLPEGEKNFEDMYNRFDRIPACDRQTDRQTDRRTDGRTYILPRHSPRYAYTSCGINHTQTLFLVSSISDFYSVSCKSAVTLCQRYDNVGDRVRLVRLGACIGPATFSAVW